MGKAEEPRTIFVFGSNLAGRHGKGSALEAKLHHGAKYGVGEGRTGDAYAIPTKGRKLEILSLSKIQLAVTDFLVYAKHHPELTFTVVEIGCGLAGYRPHEIAPMFDGYTSNVKLPQSFLWPKK
jgi:hypothetical protein